jgi:hypothetical protein
VTGIEQWLKNKGNTSEYVYVFLLFVSDDSIYIYYDDDDICES